MACLAAQEESEEEEGQGRTHLPTIPLTPEILPREERSAVEDSPISSPPTVAEVRSMCSERCMRIMTDYLM